MEPRYSSRYAYPRPRSPTFNTARAPMPSSVGFSSMYGGDIHVMPTTPRYPPAGSRGYSTVNPPANPPNTAATTTTYAVSKDPLARGPGHRETGRTHRSSTIDSAAARPVIVTTTKPRTQATASRSHHTSPSRDEFRATDSQFYTQPASSKRSRSHHRGSTYGGTSDDYAYLRSADGLLSSRPDPYRPSRPAVVYSGQPRHPPVAIDYGDAGYEYTSPSDLARYDLTHERPSRSRKRDSLDRTYHRPTVNVPTDIGRSYSNAPSGAAMRYESRGGPPPSTRGFDRLNRGGTGTAPPAFDPSPLQASVPPAVPPAPAHLLITEGSKDRAAGAYVEPATSSTADHKSSSRRRPVSVYQEGAPRSSHHEDYYRSREEDRKQRQIRDIERRYDSAYEPGHDDYFRDDDIATRGFGIRTTDSPRTDLAIVGLGDHDEYRDTRETRGARDDDRKRIRGSSRPAKETASDDELNRTRLRDKVGTGLGIAAAALGFGHAVKKDETPVDQSDKEPRRRSLDDERDRDREWERERDRERRKEEEEAAARALERVERHRARAEATGRKDEADTETRDRHQREAEDQRAGGETAKASAQDGAPDEEDSEAGKSRRRRASSSAFDPTDTKDLRDLREQLSNMKTSDSPEADKEDKPAEEDKARRESPRQPPASLTHQSSSMAVEVDDSSARGRELAPRKPEEKQVRVVSPPREKAAVKPLKGILKQPRKFPEEENPIREGVAPHKDDKKLREVPPNARWTKISRRIVNPEALTIGKERFEVRDDFVIVLRVLSSEEIQAYATATAQLREERRERERGRDRGRERDHRHSEDERPRQYRHHRRDDDYERYDEERGKERDRHRRHRRDDENEKPRY